MHWRRKSCLPSLVLSFSPSIKLFILAYIIKTWNRGYMLYHLTTIGTLLAEPFLTVHMLCTEKKRCTNPVKFLLSMLSALLSNSFEPRPNRCSFITVSFRPTFRRHFHLLPAGSVSIIGFSQKLMLALEKPVWREETGMTSPRTGATATSKDGLDLCRAYFFRV